jgi:hypothetical protein
MKVRRLAGPKTFYRPNNEKIKAKFEKSLPKLPLFTIEQAFGGWDKASKEHFADGAAVRPNFSIDQALIQLFTPRNSHDISPFPHHLRNATASVRWLWLAGALFATPALASAR